MSAVQLIRPERAVCCSVDSIDNGCCIGLEWPVGNVHPDRTSAIVKRRKQHKQLRAESTTMAVGGNARLLGFGQCDTVNSHSAPHRQTRGAGLLWRTQLLRHALT